MMGENSIKVLEYLKTVDGDVTADDVANALGLTSRQVNGSFTRAIQVKGLGERVVAEVELEDGKHKEVKFLKLNDKGMAFDPTATDAE